MWKFISVATFLTLTMTGCGAEDQNGVELDYDPMTFTVVGSNIVADGTIDGGTLARFVQVTQENPALKALVLDYVDGSVDDVANLKLGQTVRDAGFTTVVPAGGLVASGGTDLFLAGKLRVLEDGACVGVHSWSDGTRDGIDVPRFDPEHQKYLRYYRDMSIDERFYWFTLEAAPADDMHWMTAQEAGRYGMSTQPVRALGGQETCRDR